MALLQQVGTFVSPSSAGYQTITLDSGVWGSEEPKLIFFWSANSVADAIDTDFKLCFGASTPTSNFCIFNRSDNGEGTSVSIRSIEGGLRCIYLASGSGRDIVEDEGILNSVGASQFEIRWFFVSGDNPLINYLVLGGDSLEGAHFDYIGSPASPGNQDYVVGFEPTALMYIGASSGVYGDFGGGGWAASSNTAKLSMGMATLADQYATSFASHSGQPTSQTERIQSTSKFILQGVSSLNEEQAALSAFNVDGYTLTWSDAIASPIYGFVVAIKTPHVAVITDTQKTSTGSKTTALGFAGKAGLLTTFMGAASASVEDDARIGIGALDAEGNQAFAGAVDEDGQATTDADRIQDSDEILKMLDHDQNVLAAATGSFSGNNLSLNWTTADATARQFGGLILGDSPSVVSLTATDGLHSQSVDSSTMTQVHVLSSEGGLHSHSVDSPKIPHTPARWDTTIALQLEVIPQNKVLVPGCEPTSALSSTALSSYLAEAGCGNALVALEDALEAIPGSWVKFGSNFNRGNMRQKWFVLPAVDTDCPCAEYTDWYEVLRQLANEEVPEEESYDACDIIGMGYCPSPDFEDIEAPPSSPYKDEGSFPAGGGVLPPVPPWGLSGT